MSVFVTENFTGTGDLASPPWTQVNIAFLQTIFKTGGFGSGSNATDIPCLWNADLFDPNQGASCKVYNIADANSDYAGVVTRGTGNSTSTFSGYVFQGDRGLYKVVNGTWTLLATDPFAGTWTNGNILTLNTQGTTHSMNKAGSGTVNHTDATLISGAVGCCINSGDGNVLIDDWSGYDIVGAQAPPPRPPGFFTVRFMRPRRVRR